MDLTAYNTRAEILRTSLWRLQLQGDKMLLKDKHKRAARLMLRIGTAVLCDIHYLEWKYDIWKDDSYICWVQEGYMISHNEELNSSSQWTNLHRKICSWAGKIGLQRNTTLESSSLPEHLTYDRISLVMQFTSSFIRDSLGGKFVGMKV